MSWQQRIEAALAQRQRDDAYRVRLANQGGSGRWLMQGDRCYLNFSSNDYLGLSHHPEIVHAWQQGQSNTALAAAVPGM